MYICIFLIMLQSSLSIARREMSDTSMQKNKNKKTQYRQFMNWNICNGCCHWLDFQKWINFKLQMVKYVQKLFKFNPLNLLC